ncbi:unnamed protein product [Cunninghamella blakesleeana]
MVWFFDKKKDNEEQTKLTEQEEGRGYREGEEVENNNNNPYERKEQNEDLPMDLGTVQDIFSFGFIRGRPILNFFLAIIWSIGLPILLYHILRPYIGQVLAMIAASSPPLIIVFIRMFKDKDIDVLGIVAGISFLITGILSIAEPDEKTSAICEGIVPLLVGVFCLLSLIPIRIKSFEMKPLIFQFVNQVIPREEEDETLTEYDQKRLNNNNDQHKKSKRQKLDYVYSHLSRFRQDMRVMTAFWGITLIIAFIIKVVVVLTSTDTSHAETIGYIVFTLAIVLMSIFTWLYTNVVKRHVSDSTKEGLHNASWGVQSLNNSFDQVIGGG